LKKWFRVRDGIFRLYVPIRWQGWITYLFSLIAIALAHFLLPSMWSYAAISLVVLTLVAVVAIKDDEDEHDT